MSTENLIVQNVIGSSVQQVYSVEIALALPNQATKQKQLNQASVNWDSCL
jgi:hypothetical protein